MKLSGQIVAWILGLLLAFQQVLAQESAFSGQIKTQSSGLFYDRDSISAQIGPDEQFRQDFELRLMQEGRVGNFEYALHAESLNIAGNSLEQSRQLAGLLGSGASLLPDDRIQLFDLATELDSDHEFLSVARVDRFSLGYSTEQLVLRMGRQTISWGSGLLFQVMDFFNPFSPTEIDRDYKGGQDMFYAQYLFPSGDDLQFLIVPRRDPETHEVDDENASFALKQHLRVAKADFDFLISQHFEDQALALAGQTELSGGVLRFDYSLTHSPDDRLTHSMVFNLDRSWVLAGYNMYGFLEYFYNGFGVSQNSYSSADRALLERISRGELFTLNRQYLAGGFQLELSPITNFFVAHIQNLRDQSAIVQLRLEYELTQNIDLYTGLNLPYGSAGSEFGGPALAFDMEAVSYLSPARSIYMRLGYYF